MGLPVSVSVDVLAVNLEHLKQAGLALPPVDPADRSWTAEKFLAYCQQLPAATNATPSPAPPPATTRPASPGAVGSAGWPGTTRPRRRS